MSRALPEIGDHVWFKRWLGNAGKYQERLVAAITAVYTINQSWVVDIDLHDKEAHKKTFLVGVKLWDGEGLPPEMYSYCEYNKESDGKKQILLPAQPYMPHVAFSLDEMKQRAASCREQSRDFAKRAEVWESAYSMLESALDKEAKEQKQ